MLGVVLVDNEPPDMLMIAFELVLKGFVLDADEYFFLLLAHQTGGQLFLLYPHELLLVNAQIGLIRLCFGFHPSESLPILGVLLYT